MPNANRPPITVPMPMGTGTPSPTKDAGPVFADSFSTDSTVITGIGTESTFDRGLLIAANTLKVGDQLDYEFMVRQNGRYSTDNTTYKIKMDNASGASLFDSGSIAIATGADVRIKGTIYITGVGSSGSYKAASEMQGLGAQGYYTGSFDTTVDHKLIETVTFGSANAANSATLKLGTLRRYRPVA